MSVIVPIQIVPIENDGFHLLVKATINHSEANLLIDTGASRTVFDKKLIYKFLLSENVEFTDNEKLSIGLGTKTMKSQVVVLDIIKFRDFEIHDYQAIILDLKYVNESYSSLNLPEIHGVLGGDLLKKYKAVINYKTKMLKFYP